MTQKQIFDKLRMQYMADYKGHFMDMYEGHNHLGRHATKYAIKHTIWYWRAQYG